MIYDHPYSRRFLLGLCVATLGLLVWGVGTGTNVPAIGQQKNSIVRVLDPSGRGGGTGFAVATPINGRKVIVTNWHVCQVAVRGAVLVNTPQGNMLSYVIAADPKRDLCAVEAPEDTPILAVSETRPSQFEHLHVLGHPRLEQLTLEYGRYTGEFTVAIAMEPNDDGECFKGMKPTAKIAPYEQRESTAESMFGLELCVMPYQLAQTTVRIYPGNSGSPVLNERGQIVGVMNASDNESFKGLMIPLRHLKGFLLGLDK